MINRLEAIQKRYDEISQELSSSEVISNIKKMTELSKEQRRLSTTVEMYQKYKSIISDIEPAKEMLTDKDMQEFAKEEINTLTKEKEKIEKFRGKLSRKFVNSFKDKFTNDKEFEDLMYKLLAEYFNKVDAES